MACCSRLNGSVHSDSSTMQHGDGTAEMTISSYNSNTGRQQSMHSRHISDRVHTLLSYTCDVYVGKHVMSVQQVMLPKGKAEGGYCTLACLGVSAVQSFLAVHALLISVQRRHLCVQGYTVTRSQSSRQSAARTNRILQNLEADGLPGFERDWASRHQSRLPAQAYQGTAGYHSPGILEIPSERVHAAYDSRTHGGR